MASASGPTKLTDFAAFDHAGAGVGVGPREAGLSLPSFLVALLRVAFWRANPSFAESRSVAEMGIVKSEAAAEARLMPLPEALAKLLVENLVPNAQTLAVTTPGQTVAPSLGRGTGSSGAATASSSSSNTNSSSAATAATAATKYAGVAWHRPLSAQPAVARQLAAHADRLTTIYSSLMERPAGDNDDDVPFPMPRHGPPAALGAADASPPKLFSSGKFAAVAAAAANSAHSASKASPVASPARERERERAASPVLSIRSPSPVPSMMSMASMGEGGVPKPRGDGRGGVPLDSLVALLASAGLLGRSEIEQRSGVTPNYGAPAPRLVADLPEELLRTIHTDVRPPWSRPIRSLDSQIRSTFLLRLCLGPISATHASCAPEQPAASASAPA